MNTYSLVSTSERNGIGEGEYNGLLTTYASTSGTTRSDIFKIQTIIEEVRQMAGIHKNVFTVKPNRDIELKFYWITGKFPNLFLPAEDRNEDNSVSFDSVVSYMMYRLAKAGYAYNGEVLVATHKTYWKLRVNAGEVFRIEGKLAVVYYEDNEYQVGGMEL